MDLVTGALEVKHAGNVLKNITEAVVGEEEIDSQLRTGARRFFHFGSFGRWGLLLLLLSSYYLLLRRRRGNWGA